ncbi:unnamed protein product [Mycena citricolor]|uniref:Uncharacterized protein n=1 Tax=Mycena citricolor TaxID=2018698 RepID=A0AAD2H921_9AGAR|nr:unnamed protein product [Mycena citricolor]
MGFQKKDPSSDFDPEDAGNAFRSSSPVLVLKEKKKQKKKSVLPLIPEHDTLTPAEPTTSPESPTPHASSSAIGSQTPLPSLMMLLRSPETREFDEISALPPLNMPVVSPPFATFDATPAISSAQTPFPPATPAPPTTLQRGRPKDSPVTTTLKKRQRTLEKSGTLGSPQRQELSETMMELKRRCDARLEERNRVKNANLAAKRRLEEREKAIAVQRLRTEETFRAQDVVRRALASEEDGGANFKSLDHFFTALLRRGGDAFTEAASLVFHERLERSNNEDGLL